MRPPVFLLVFLALCLGAALASEWAPQHGEAPAGVAMTDQPLEEGCSDGCGCPIEFVRDDCCCGPQPESLTPRASAGESPEVRARALVAVRADNGMERTSASISGGTCGRGKPTTTSSTPPPPVVLEVDARDPRPSAEAVLAGPRAFGPWYDLRGEPATPPPRREFA